VFAEGAPQTGCGSTGAFGEKRNQVQLEGCDFARDAGACREDGVCVTGLSRKPDGAGGQEQDGGGCDRPRRPELVNGGGLPAGARLLQFPLQLGYTQVPGFKESSVLLGKAAVQESAIRRFSASFSSAKTPSSAK